MVVMYSNINDELGYEFTKKSFKKEEIRGEILKKINEIGENTPIEIPRVRKLEKVITNSLRFQEIIGDVRGISLARTPRELLDIMELRSKCFQEVGYDNEFQDGIQGLLFDEFDQNSIILTYRSGTKILGSIRAIRGLSDQKYLPSEVKLNKEKKPGVTFELSRLVVEKNEQKKGIAFKNLFRQVHTLSQSLHIDNFIFSTISEHKKLYSKFGGIEIEDIERFGEINRNCAFYTWKPTHSSQYFNRVFLSK